jgi:hypothetical protein
MDRSFFEPSFGAVALTDGERAEFFRSRTRLAAPKVTSS